jgi:ribosomal protein S18 acetylase RimI-like enzyme
MPSARLDLSHTPIPGHIQGNLSTYMRLFAVLPEAQMHDAESFWFISHKPAPGNVILRANFPTDQTETAIDTLFEQVGQHIDEIGWMVFPGDQPADLNQRLEARGMPGTPAGNWLWADLKSLGAAPPAPANFRIEKVRDDAMMTEWTRLSETGFGSEDLTCFYDAYAHHGYGDDALSIHYTGYLDDTPVTTGTLLDAGGTATIYDLSTPPAYRGQGVGGALTHFMMREILARGYSDTWIWASDMAQSLYRKLGYIDADFGVREHNWHK